MTRRPDVLLVSPPFGPLGTPSLGLSLLQACLRREKIATTVWHLGLDFALEAGVSEYRLVTDELVSAPDLTGDWIFAGGLRDAPADPEPWLAAVLEGGDRAHAKPRSLRIKDPARTRARLISLRALAVPFLDRAARAIVAASPRVVGFTSMFSQTAAALGLARRVKALDPAILVALGGANAEAEMGEALFASFPFLDVVVSGEGERRFPPLVAARLEGREMPRLAGVLAREGLLAPGPRCDPGPVDLGSLPQPDFGDYFTRMRELGLRLKVELPFEMSRGCWWGEKRHCAFCGLNGAAMAFRRKPAAASLAELAALRSRHPGHRIAVVDNILDMAAFRDLLPALAAQPDPPRLFLEVKANLTRAQLRLLAAAGVAGLQPGIESLSNDVLRLMHKGLTAIQGIQLLREGARLGLDIGWNLLAGLPGEDPAEYDRMARLVPLLSHLQPPRICGTIRLDRFSPLYSGAAAAGLVNVRAFPAYRHVYDLPQETLDRMAYFLDFAYADGREVASYFAPLEEAVARWTSERGVLGAEVVSSGVTGGEVGGGEVLVVDERSCAAARSHRLTGAQAWALLTCDTPRSDRALAAMAEAPGGPGRAALEAALEALQVKKLLLHLGGERLSLPV